MTAVGIMEPHNNVQALSCKTKEPPDSGLDTLESPKDTKPTLGGNQNVPRRRCFAAQFRDIPDTVESMGLRPIFDPVSPVPRRIFWLLVVAFGIGFAGYQIVTQVS